MLNSNSEILDYLIRTFKYNPYSSFMLQYDNDTGDDLIS
jgi:hypothetical protein